MLSCCLFLKIYDITAQLVKMEHFRPVDSTHCTNSIHTCQPQMFAWRDNKLKSPEVCWNQKDIFYLSPSEKSALKPVKATVQVFGSSFWKLQKLQT